ncbi:hypothetical protein IT397_01725 [Candidatus Nomurabacteria bacterium]|nr:hypothetical protein [Candidatus Nomurabacteria bacterium]
MVMKLAKAVFIFDAVVFLGIIVYLFCPEIFVGYPDVYKYYTGESWEKSLVAEITLPDGTDVPVDSDKARQILAGRYHYHWVEAPKWMVSSESVDP